MSTNHGSALHLLHGPGGTFAGLGIEGSEAPVLTGIRGALGPESDGGEQGGTTASDQPTTETQFAQQGSEIPAELGHSSPEVTLPADTSMESMSVSRALTPLPEESPVSESPALDAPLLGPTGRPRRPLVEPAPLETHGPARILAVCNQKGGVGKTTTTINLGAALAGYGRRVLLVDLDPQGALSVGLGVQASDLDLTVHNLLLDSNVTADDVLLKTGVVGLDLLPSNIDLSYAEVQLVGEVAREMTLARVLAPLVPDYDYILLDCQPSLGLLTVNALTAAHGVVIPLECEWFALRGVQLLTDTIEKIQTRLNPQLKIEGVLATMFDSRTLHTRQVVERLVEAFGDTLFDSVIGRTVKFPDATVAGEPITTFAPSSTAATAYRDLAKEVLAR